MATVPDGTSFVCAIVFHEQDTFLDNGKILTVKTNRILNAITHESLTNQIMNFEKHETYIKQHYVPIFNTQGS